MHLLVGHQHSLFWPILARFVDYYSSFSGPGAIFMAAEAQGALTILADSGPFHGLLLIDLGFRSDFYGY